ncbi:MAG: STAS domain-containing protein [Burkholderiales bacterium]|nr:STAS domain-containing protein [Burkholderiales bacterium]
MSKEENGSGGNGMGLLSKVVRFVRNPTTNWSDLDQQDADRDSSYSKQALKEMIERKRRNDFVRKREFDMLRKLRRREALGVQNPNARPSFFQISTSSSKPDDRAMTLKKIDEIEEQMSMQWWKTKHGEPTGTERTSHSPLGTRTAGGPGINTNPSPLGNETVPPDGVMLRPDGDNRTNFQLTEPAIMSSAPRGAPPAPEPPGNNLDLMASGFFGSEMFNVDVDEVAHDPELEEAAIRFANGDDAGAEQGLLDAIADGAARSRHEETWLALFDLYRATGQHDPFEALADRFTRKFDRSAPAWISIPDLNSRVAPPRVQAAPAALMDSEVHWTAPASLTLEGLAGLVAVLRRTSPPWHLDWRALSSVQDEAVEPLYRQLAILAEQPAQLGFAGARHLDAFLQGMTPSNDRSVPPAWWLLRMTVLRILRRPDDFELVALNYCVTYEVSPPSWEPPACGFVALDGDSMSEPGNTFIGEAHESQVPTVGGEAQPSSSFPPTGAPGSEHPGAALKVDLAGQILGDATSALDVLDQRLAGAEDMVISCAGLVRVDFSAAGTLLNWVSTRHAHGKRVHFCDVHRLVSAFFGVIGISELARVTPRKD